MTSSYNAEIDLVEHLRSSYKGPKFLRPVARAGDALVVHVGYSVVSVDVCEDSGVANITAYLVKSWTDRNLTWDPARFGGIKELRLPRSELWTPDIVSPYVFEEVEDERALVVVGYNGKVLNVPMIRHKIQATKVGPGCFQIQLVLCSCVYDSTRIRLQLTDPSGIDLTQVMEGRWHVASGGVKLAGREFTFEDWKETYPMATYIIDIKKKA